jgi:HSP20 family molecular chaperone IbpA
METGMIKRENGSLAETQKTPRPWASAPVDVYESANEYLVFADVPGVSKDHVSIEFANGELRIHASRQGEGDWAIDYRRPFTVGRDVDVEKIDAELTNGVLQVHLRKLESAKPRQIAIRSGE